MTCPEPKGAVIAEALALALRLGKSGPACFALASGSRTFPRQPPPATGLTAPELMHAVM